MSLPYVFILLFFFLMIRRPPISTRTDTLFPYTTLFRSQPNTKIATLVFGFFHGFGLATKIIEFQIAKDGLVPNLIAFNIGVEIGQLLALGGILIAMGFWRRTSRFMRHAFAAHVLLMTADFVHLVSSDESRVGTECVSTCRCRW